MLDRKMDWNGGMDYGIEKKNFFHSNTQLYSVAICFTNVFIAGSAVHSCSLLKVVRVKGHVHT